MITPGTWKAIKPAGAPYWGIATDSIECTVAGTASGLNESDAKLCAIAPQLRTEVISLILRYEMLRRLHPSIDFDGMMGGEVSSLKRILTDYNYDGGDGV